MPYSSKEGLHLLIDSTGNKDEGEWQRRKYAGSKRRIWRKNHIAVDEKTLELRAIEVTSSTIGDAAVIRPVRTPAYGNPQPTVPRLATTPFRPQSGYGLNEADITDEPAWRRR